MNNYYSKIHSTIKTTIKQKCHSWNWIVAAGGISQPISKYDEQLNVIDSCDQKKKNIVSRYFPGDMFFCLYSFVQIPLCWCFTLPLSMWSCHFLHALFECFVFLKMEFSQLNVDDESEMIERWLRCKIHSIQWKFAWAETYSYSVTP